MRTIRLLWLLLTWVAADDESCPADGSGPESCRARATHPPSTTSPPRKVAPQTFPAQPQVDLISQEIQELEELIKLGQSRMDLLKELHGATEGNSPLPMSESQLRALREQLPPLSSIAEQGETMPVATHEDFIVSKTVIPLDEAVSRVRWLALRPPKPPSSSSSSSSSSTQNNIPSTVLSAVHADGNVRLFSPSGDLLFSFSAGHEQPVTQLAVSPTHEEHLLATGDASGAIRVHRVNIRQRRQSKEDRHGRPSSTSDEKTSWYLGSQLNISVQLSSSLQVPAGTSGNTPRLTSLAVATNRNGRQVVAGDADGRISIFAKNGTLRGIVDATVMEGPGVEGLQAAHTQLIFWAGMEWGFVNLEQAEVKHVECPKFEGRVAWAAIDSNVLSRVLLSDEAGIVWAFNVKNKKECEFERHFPPSTLSRAPIEVSSIKGFVIGLQKEFTDSAGVDHVASLMALNMSAAAGERRRPNEQGNGQHVVWRRSRSGVRDWSLIKRQQQGDLVALLSADGKEIEVFEMLMHVYTPPAVTDPFTSFKVPILICAVLLVLGYQYMKHKGKGSTGGFGGLGKRKDLKSDFASMLKNKKMGRAAPTVRSAGTRY